MGLNSKKFIFIAFSPTGTGISGGDRIFIELARNWSKKFKVTVVTTTEGRQMCARQHLTGKYLTINIFGQKLPKSFLVKYLYKIILGIKFGLTFNTQKSYDIYLYSASDFWMDTIPAFLLKIRFPKVNWIATWYQTAPSPHLGFAEAERETKYRLSSLPYWFSQFSIKPFVKKYADRVIVNNENEKKIFPTKTQEGKTIVLIGAVPLSSINNWRNNNEQYNNKNVKKVYDAVFQGRFHPQKGVVELIEIWKKVVDKMPHAKLAMIGDGPLMPEVKKQITKYKQQKNIELFGFLFDGDEKYKIFAQSKMVVHPAFYDSGGMASAEAMTFGNPCVGFDLPAYKSYYPKGMIKVKKGDLNSFAKKIIEFINDKKYRDKIGREAVQMIEANWSWEKRANEVLDKINA